MRTVLNSNKLVVTLEILKQIIKKIHNSCKGNIIEENQLYTLDTNGDFTVDIE